MHATLAPARGTVGRVARAEGRFEAEGWRVRKDGSRFRASVVIDPVLEDGELVGYAKVTRDITERYEAEQELEQARKALLEAQKMESIGKLTVGLAHDFNNLNTIMINSLELIGARHAGDQRTGFVDAEDLGFVTGVIVRPEDSRVPEPARQSTGLTCNIR